MTKTIMIESSLMTGGVLGKEGLTRQASPKFTISRLARYIFLRYINA